MKGYISSNHLCSLPDPPAAACVPRVSANTCIMPTQLEETAAVILLDAIAQEDFQRVAAALVCGADPNVTVEVRSRCCFFNKPLFWCLPPPGKSCRIHDEYGDHGSVAHRPHEPRGPRAVPGM